VIRTPSSPPSPAARGRAKTILNRLVKRYPKIGTALDYRDAWQLLVVTVLSAQTTDENVNKVAPELFDRFPKPHDLAGANPSEVESIVHSTGFFRQKTKSIIGLAAALSDRFDGEVPRDLDALVTLPGVGRKTASVVLAEVWDVPAIAVDTHVRRVTKRLALTASDKPEQVEVDLKALFPEARWSGISMRFIQFGRDVCRARSPLCRECELEPLCPWPGKVL